MTLAPVDHPVFVNAPKPRRRGFVMVVVIAVMLILFAALTATLSSVRQNKLIALRQTENAKARNIAEMCLAKGVAVATAHFQMRGGEDFDFDHLLDPDQDPGSGDEFVFFETGSTTTQVPAATTDDLHRFSFARLHGGACFLRFDDNNDDSLPGYTAQTSNTPDSGGTPVVEGAGVNVAVRDRDASIYVTAIGVYPAFTGVADNEVYDRAHARMTLRQFFTATASPTLYGNGDITIGNSVEICGTGGVRGQNITVDASSCICGDALALDITDGLGACTPDTTRCPDGVVGSPSNPASFPSHSTVAADFPNRCAPYGVTEGEPPQLVVVTDVVSGQSYGVDQVTGGGVAAAPVFTDYGNNSAANYFRNPKCRFYFRAADRAVFMWDGRAATTTATTALAGLTCDGLGAPPAPLKVDKDNVCALVQAGGTCADTPADARDDEFCAFPGPGPVPPATRCDLLAPWPPVAPTDAAKNAVCNAVVPGATCNITPAARDVESCTPPASFVNCRADSNPVPPPLAAWDQFDEDAALFEATPPADRRQLCWRMVGTLNGAVSPTDGPNTASDLAGAVAPEWEMPGSAFAITSAVVPNLRNDPNLEIRNGAVVVPPRIEDVCQMRTTAEAQAGVTRFTPLGVPRPIADAASGRWTTPAGWHNHDAADRRLPTPAVLLFQGDLDVLGDTQLDGVTLLTTGNAHLTGGTTTLVAADVRAFAASLSPFSYAGGVDRCSLEVNEHIRAAWTNAAGSRSVTTSTMAPQPAAVGASARFALRANGSCQIDGAVTVLGRVSCGGDLDVKTGSCLVGGLSAGGGALGTFDGSCSSGDVDACANPGICLEQRTAVLGDVFSNQDVTLPAGIFLSRGTTGLSNGLTGLKIGRIASGAGNICVDGPARIVGQLVSGRVGGQIQVANDVLFLHSGEVGFGFGTRRSVFTDGTW